MIQNVFTYDGDSGYSGIFYFNIDNYDTSSNTIRSFGKDLLTYPQFSRATSWLQYINGNGDFIPGEQISTDSLVVCSFVSQVKDNVDASRSTGILMLTDILSNLDFNNDYNSPKTLVGLKSGASADVYSDFITILLPYRQPRAAILSVPNNQSGASNLTCGINYTTAATIPWWGNDTERNWGLFLDLGDLHVIRGYNNIRNFRCVAAAKGNTTILKYELLF
jgi:hypothetical protein